MTTLLPTALNKVYTWIGPYLQTEQRGGIVNAASPGYHTSREDLIRQGRSNDYSIQSPADKRGNAKMAAGIDITFGSLAELITVQKRLRAACTPNADGKYDDRIECIREFIGTLDGRAVSGYNRYASGTGSRSRTGWFSSGFGDSSHLWHIHISVFRDRVENENEMRGLAEVIAGLAPGSLGWIDEDAKPPVVVDPPVVEPPVVEPPFCWDGKSYPGADRLKEGANGPWVTYFGKRLVAHGYKGYKVGPGPEWGQADTDGVIWFKRKQGWSGGPTVGKATWDLLVAEPKPEVPQKPADENKPEEPNVTYYTETIFGWNILRRTDTEPGRKRYPTRKPLIAKVLRDANASVYLLNETDSVTGADAAAALGSGFSYWRFKYYTIIWDSSIWERRGDAVNEFEFRDNNNRWLLSLPLFHKKSGKQIVFDCTHLENDGDPKTDGHKARFVEATHLAEKAGKGDRVGFWDCNSTTPPTTKPATVRESQKPRVVLKNKIKAKFLSEIKAKVKNGAYATHHGGKGSAPKGAWIDDAWLVGDIEFVDGEVVRTDGNDASDHNTLKFRIKFKG